MSSTPVKNKHVPWVSGVVKKVGSQSHEVELHCSRCGDRDRRRTCCFDLAADAVRIYGMLHVQCTVKLKKETVL